MGRLLVRSPRGAAGTIAASVGAAVLLAACGGPTVSVDAQETPAMQASTTKPSSSESDGTGPTVAPSAGPGMRATPNLCVALPSSTVGAIIGEDPGAGITNAEGGCDYQDVDLHLDAVAGSAYQNLVEGYSTALNLASNSSITGVGSQAMFFVFPEGNIMVAADPAWAVVAGGPWPKESLLALARSLLEVLN